jgi:hypothetical protein
LTEVLDRRALTLYEPTYPGTHLGDLRRYLTPLERDARGLFWLSDDQWPAWPYAGPDQSRDASFYRLGFASLASFLKPYAKLYAYEHLLLAPRPLTRSASRFPRELRRADQWLVSHGIASLDELSNRTVFGELWASLADDWDHARGGRPPKTVRYQTATNMFWRVLSVRFGAPIAPPRIFKTVRLTPATSGLDESRLIPGVVIKQIANLLALHRDGEIDLGSYDHVRFCIVMLLCCTGRRVREVLEAPRGVGAPLRRYPGPDGHDAMWFRFRPLKDGPGNEVYISREWEEIAQYCVDSIVEASDAVRSFAPPEHQDRLILVSGTNGTGGPNARRSGRVGRVGRAQLRAWPLTYNALAIWTNGGGRQQDGAMARFGVTTDGSRTGEIYWLRLHAARHTRQTALLADDRVPRLATQRDLNHSNREMQVAYQHALRESNERLIGKARAGRLLGPGADWIKRTTSPSGFVDGEPIRLDSNPRWRALVQGNAAFLTINRVPMGYCTLAQGPTSCPEYMLCAEARDDGCAWFAVDPDDGEALLELADRLEDHKTAVLKARAAGQKAAAGKESVLMARTEHMLETALNAASAEVRAALRARLKVGRQE